MKQLTCEMCGSTDLMKDGGVFVCQSCGCKYSVEEAKRMIRENAYNFTEISEMLGFSTPHYFSTVFKKTINMTPSEYANSIKAIIDDDIV